MSHGGPDRRIAEIAVGQHGVVTRAQATAAGLSRRMIQVRVSAGRLEWASRRVLRIHGTPGTWHQGLMVAVLEAGPGATVSHRGAAQLHRLDTFGTLGRRWIEVTTPTDRNHRSKTAIIHRSGDLEPGDIVSIDGIDCTSVARTLTDLGAVVPRSRVEHATDGALRDARVEATDLRMLLERVRRKGRSGVGALEFVLVTRGSLRPQSVLEREFLRAVRRHGVATPVTQLHVRRPDGRDAYLDFAYPNQRIAIEVDGHGSHATRAQRANDAERTNQLILAGWSVVRFTWTDVRDRPAYVAGVVRRTLTASRVVA